MKTGQESLVEYLQSHPSAFSHKVSKIDLEETHISWVLLTGKFAYKFKKGLKFGKVLDFSTLQKRKKICQKEIDLNRPLCGKMYVGLVKAVKTNNGFSVVRDSHRGRALEYAVKMLELPQQYRMDYLLQKKRVTKRTIKRIAKILAKFHKETKSGKKILQFGRPSFIASKINENFRTLEKLKKIDPTIEKNILLYIKDNRKIFENRSSHRKIKDIHGDLHTKNVFIMNNRIYLYDRIEFNESLRYADVLEDVSHLAMDLDFQGNSYLGNYFVEEYKKINKESEEITDLIRFYMCYKASMRAKVSFFQAKNETDKTKSKNLKDDGSKLLKLAKSYEGLF